MKKEYFGFEQIRDTLDSLASLITEGTDVRIIDALVGEVQNKLEELETVRTRVFPRVARGTEPPPIVNPQPVKQAPVQVKAPKASEMPAVPGSSRRVPLSTCYNPERYVPYKVLWAKVIIRAAYDYALWRDSKDMRLKKFAQDAERWLFESSDLSLSFENICFSFGFPVDRIRTRTRALTKHDVKKLEFRERHGRIEAILDPIEEPTDGNDG